MEFNFAANNFQFCGIFQFSILRNWKEIRNGKISNAIRMNLLLLHAVTSFEYVYLSKILSLFLILDILKKNYIHKI